MKKIEMKTETTVWILLLILTATILCMAAFPPPASDNGLGQELHENEIMIRNAQSDIDDLKESIIEINLWYSEFQADYTMAAPGTPYNIVYHPESDSYILECPQTTPIETIQDYNVKYSLIVDKITLSNASFEHPSFYIMDNSDIVLVETIVYPQFTIGQGYIYSTGDIVGEADL